MPSLAIIGNGYSAAVCVYHLFKSGFSSQEITVFGKGAFGHGQAYGTLNPDFRLNVRAEIMRIDPDHPDDFPYWAKANLDDPDAHNDAGSFYRRSDFARYMTAKMTALAETHPIHHRDETVTSIAFDGQWMVTSDNVEARFDLLILATGNPPPALRFELDPQLSPFLTTNPWQGDWTGKLDPAADIAIIGGGLTAMDAIASLEAMKHQGSVTIISPKGLLPPPQLDWVETPDLDWPEPQSALALYRFMANTMAKGDWLDRPTQDCFENLRKGVSPAWRGLPKDEKLKLLRHFGWLWQLLRYRASPQTVMSQKRLSTADQLTLIKGRVVSITPSSDDRGTAKPLHLTLSSGDTLAADHAIIATGAGQDLLIKAMGDSKTLRLEAQQLMVDESLRMIDSNGQAYATGFALGPPTVFSRGDVVGATTIAGEAKLIAKTITHQIDVR